MTIHETDNTSNGANADAHARLQANGNIREASWHWQVDDKEAIQSFEHTWMCWAAGTTKGNKESIHIEICVNSDGNYQKAVQNAAALTKIIMRDENISIENVVQHNYWSGKNCPKIMRSGSNVTWIDFKKLFSNSNSNSKEKEDVHVYQPSNATMINSTAMVLQSFENKDVHGDLAISPAHREKLVKGELSLDDAIALIYVALYRGLIQGNKLK
nr:MULTISPECIES: N-acetylmuramoyl-L-alanine amidase [Bacillus]